MSCYCEEKSKKVLEGILNKTIPDEVLVKDCCWRTICRVRGQNLPSVNPETWKEICRKRAHLKF